MKKEEIGETSKAVTIPDQIEKQARIVNCKLKKEFQPAVPPNGVSLQVGGKP